MDKRFEAKNIETQNEYPNGYVQVKPGCTENLRNPTNHKVIARVGEGTKLKFIKKAENRGKWEYAIVKLGDGDKEYKICTNDRAELRLPEEEKPPEPAATTTEVITKTKSEKNEVAGKTQENSAELARNLETVRDALIKLEKLGEVKKIEEGAFGTTIEIDNKKDPEENQSRTIFIPVDRWNAIKNQPEKFLAFTKEVEYALMQDRETRLNPIKKGMREGETVGYITPILMKYGLADGYEIDPATDQPLNGEKIVDASAVDTSGEKKYGIKNGAAVYFTKGELLNFGETKLDKRIAFEKESASQKEALAKYQNKSAAIEAANAFAKEVNKTAESVYQPKIESAKNLLTNPDGQYLLLAKRIFGKDSKLLEAFDGGFDLAKFRDNKNEEMAPWRAGSTQAAEKAAEAHLQKNPNDKQNVEKLLAAFKVIDITYARSLRGSGSEARVAALDEKVLDANGNETTVDKLFGGEMKWAEFYKKEKTEKFDSKNKLQIKSMLDGGQVFMLRGEPSEKKPGKLDAWIDGMPGSALIESLDTADKVRGDKNYKFKYRAIETTADLVGKYRKENPEISKLFEGKSDEEITEYFTAAQFEVPNCENPAVVVKLEKLGLKNLPPKPEVDEPTIPIEERKKYIKNGGNDNDKEGGCIGASGGINGQRDSENI